MSNIQFLSRLFVFYHKNQLQFLYYLILLRIKYSLRVFCPYRSFLYLYIVTLLAFLHLLPFKYVLHYLTFILYLLSIVTFYFLHYYGPIYLDWVLFCPTWISFFTLLVPNIIYPSYFGLLLFDKYCQRTYKS